jgi:hypothetical protein
MPRNLDYGSEKAAKFELLPAGDYLLEIAEVSESETKEKGLYMVTVHYKVLKPDQYKGRQVKYHNVVFIPAGNPGAGRVLYFLKTIGEPYEGAVSVNPQNWIGKRIAAKVGVKTYNGRQNNEVNDFDVPNPAKTGAVEDSEVPF